MKSVRLGFWIALASVLAFSLAGPALAGKINGAGDETIVPKLRLSNDAGWVEQAGTPSGAGSTHESGYSVQKNGCQKVLCSTVGDGGVVTKVVGQRYVEKVIDQNNSPVTIATGRACGSFDGVGEMKKAGEVFEGAQYQPDGGTGATTFETCCAQTATASPAGPYYEVCPEN